MRKSSQPRSRVWQYVKTVLEQPQAKQLAHQGHEVARLTPDSDGKFWFDLVCEGRYAGGVKILLESEAAKFLLGSKSELGFAALKTTMMAANKQFAHYLKPDMRLELADNMIIGFA
jgi:hypothetical protein